MENEIIKLLTDIVGSIKKNNEILIQNNQLLMDLQNKLDNVPSGGGSGGSDFDKMGNNLKHVINDIQKGFQVMEINRALNDVRELMSFISDQPVQVQASNNQEIPPKPPTSKGSPAPPKDEPKDDGHLLKPSDLFG